MGPDDEAWSRAQGDFFGGGPAGSGGAPSGPVANPSAGRGAAPAPAAQQFGTPSGFGDSSFGGTSTFGTPAGPGTSGLATAAATNRPTGRRTPRITGVGRWIRYGLVAALVAGAVIVVNDYVGAWRDRSATTITFPEQATGYTLMDGPEFDSVLQQGQANLPSMGGSKPAAAVYTRPGGGLGVMVFAARKRIPLVPFGLRDEPSTIVDSMINVASKPNTPMSDLRQLKPGKLGGRLVCARMTLRNQPVTTMCAGDNATSIVAMIYEAPSVTDSNVVALREAVVKQK